MADAFWLDRGEVFRSTMLDRESWLAHAFGTRRGAPVPNYHEPDWELVTVKQIHSANVIDAGGPLAPATEGDALITRTPGLALAVKTADCFPILLADPERRVVAAIHAGWRGTVQEIVSATVARMIAGYKTNPSALLAAIGPGIGKCHFEVGPEVARQFAKWEPRLAAAEGKELLDLASIAMRQLTDLGVAESNMAPAGLCTMDGNGLFFSFRREREAAGRMFSWIGIRR